MVHGLFLGEAGHGGQHPKGVAAEQDEVFGVGSHTRDHGIVYVVDGIGGPGVFSDSTAYMTAVSRRSCTSQFLTISFGRQTLIPCKFSIEQRLRQD